MGTLRIASARVCPGFLQMLRQCQLCSHASMSNEGPYLWAAAKPAPGAHPGTRTRALCGARIYLPRGWLHPHMADRGFGFAARSYMHVQ